MACYTRGDGLSYAEEKRYHAQCRGGASLAPT